MYSIPTPKNYKDLCSPWNIQKSIDKIFDSYEKNSDDPNGHITIMKAINFQVFTTLANSEHCQVVVSFILVLTMAFKEAGWILSVTEDRKEISSEDICKRIQPTNLKWLMDRVYLTLTPISE